MASDSRTSARRPNALIRTGLGADAIATALIENLHCLQGKLPWHATRNDWYMVLAYTVRDRMMERYVAIVGSKEPGLGTGGLGCLAACYMDSLATLNVPAIGCGIRYEFGIFDQAIRNGWQVEVTEKWLRFWNPWEIVRSEIACDVKFGGAPSLTTTRAAIACAGLRRRCSRVWPVLLRTLEWHIARCVYWISFHVINGNET